MPREETTTPDVRRNTRRSRLTPEELRKLSPTLRALVIEQGRDDRQPRASRRKGIVSFDEAHDAPGEAVAVRVERATMPAGYALEPLGEVTWDLVRVRDGKVLREATRADLAERSAGHELRARLGKGDGRHAFVKVD